MQIDRRNVELVLFQGVGGSLQQRMVHLIDFSHLGFVGVVDHPHAISVNGAADADDGKKSDVDDDEGACWYFFDVVGRARCGSRVLAVEEKEGVVGVVVGAGVKEEEGSGGVVEEAEEKVAVVVMKKNKMAGEHKQ